MLEILYRTPAQRVLARLPRDRAATIQSKITQLAIAPETLANNLKAVKGSDAMRLRVGDWRVFFRLRDQTLEVITIEPRGRAYR